MYYTARRGRDLYIEVINSVTLCMGMLLKLEQQLDVHKPQANAPFRAAYPMCGESDKYALALGHF